MQRRALFALPWLAIALVAGIVVLLTGWSGSGSRAVAATERFGPPEAEVTQEGEWKAVHLTASKFEWQFRTDQEPVEVWGYNEQIPGPTLHFREGDKVRIYFRNDLDEPSSIHWHGLIVPYSMDGIGGLTQPPVYPGETFVYEIEIPSTPGTFMYHAHMNDMEQVGMGLSGAFVVDPRDGGDGRYDQDRIMLLNNIEGHYLVNGKEFPNIDPYVVRKGDLIRVRMINISPIEIHPMHFHGHFTKEVAKDGTDLSNTGDGRVENTVLLAPGQTVDVEVRMNAPGKGVWLFHCHVLSHVMGPDGRSTNIALANGGMVVPVVYEDSDDIDSIMALLTEAINSVATPAAGGTASGTHDVATGEVHQ
jgi:FtsP/CotA-like multicopper oxidase with cupredoxin domain